MANFDMLIANLFLPYRRTTYQETDSRLIEKQIHGSSRNFTISLTCLLL